MANRGRETVPNSEKIFSVFEPHTELVNRGKTPEEPAGPVVGGHGEPDGGGDGHPGGDHQLTRRRPAPLHVRHHLSTGVVHSGDE